MKKLLFISVMMMTACTGFQAPATTCDVDSTEVDTVVVDSTLIDSVAVDSICTE